MVQSKFERFLETRRSEEAKRFVHDSGLEMSECLFLPYYEYRGKNPSGSDIYQLGEPSTTTSWG